jgi:hypothetical protein
MKQSLMIPTRRNRGPFAVGDAVWCTAARLDHDGSLAAVRPWCGKVARDFGHGCVRVSRGKGPSNNAISYQDTTHATELDAWGSYAAVMVGVMEAACDELESAAKHIDRLTKGGNG